ncbi:MULTISPECIES: GNAT family N-acetyltransferase [unclassified Actinotalea]|uniref:GNAT family N-acetyltransferase n=1 Tax=unclassified Actinotalea TaxID=2638618 RepID=UPI0015F44D46|nr:MULTISPECIES: GNAT family protein [unclassified Actinotalea]
MTTVPVIDGELVRLRPIGPQDADHVWEMLEDLEGLRMTGTTTSFTRAQVEEWCATVADREGRLDWAVTHGSDEFLGEIVLTDVDAHSANANLRLSMRPGQRGRGFGGEAIELVLRHAFAEAPEGLGLHRVSLEVLSINPRARMLYESLGFVVEGRLRDAHRDGDRWCDAIVMGILDEEHRAWRDAQAAVLAADERARLAAEAERRALRGDDR